MATINRGDRKPPGSFLLHCDDASLCPGRVAIINCVQSWQCALGRHEWATVLFDRKCTHS